MNQTVTANIGGIVFHIEVDAFDNLTNYLNKIKSYFNNSEEREEIMKDIEGRIAEIFSSKLNSKNQVIKQSDVIALIEVMGKPEQYVDEGEIHQEERKSTNIYRTAKKFFRDPDDRLVGGVASGVANYFGIDAVWIRLFFVGALFFGFGFLFYIILWMAIPEAKTASDKLQMKGKVVNIDNIGKTFKEEARRVSENLKKNGQQYGKKAEFIIESFFNILGTILTGVFNIVSKILGFVFLIAGLFLMGWVVVAAFDNSLIYTYTSMGISGIETEEVLKLIFTSSDQYNIFLISLLIAVSIPIIGLILGGVKMLFKIPFNSSVGISLGILWFIAIFSLVTLGLKIHSDQNITEKVTQTQQVVTNFSNYILVIKPQNLPETIMSMNDFSIAIDEDKIYTNQIRLTIEESSNNNVELLTIKKAKGKTSKDALKRAQNIHYSYLVEDSVIAFDPFWSSLKENRIRHQGIELILRIPIGKSVYIDQSMKDIIYDIKNVTNTYDAFMLGEKWIMLEDGLTCLDCDDIDGSITSNELELLKENQKIVSSTLPR